MDVDVEMGVGLFVGVAKGGVSLATLASDLNPPNIVVDGTCVPWALELRGLVLNTALPTAGDADWPNENGDDEAVVLGKPPDTVDKLGFKAIGLWAALP